jgi:hypothetical protein
MGMMLLAYFLQQHRAGGSHSGLYLWLNLLGALAMIVSLLHFWNLASFLLELAWAAISFYGLVKHYKNTQERGLK